jgi:hypothetical protein
MDPKDQTLILLMTLGPLNILRESEAVPSGRDRKKMCITTILNTTIKPQVRPQVRRQGEGGRYGIVHGIAQMI